MSQTLIRELQQQRAHHLANVLFVQRHHLRVDEAAVARVETTVANLNTQIAEIDSQIQRLEGRATK